jgi:hypothetical protein
LGKRGDLPCEEDFAERILKNIALLIVGLTAALMLLPIFCFEAILPKTERKLLRL